MAFYSCVEDGELSALYEKRVRKVQWVGYCGPVLIPLTFEIIEYRRVTCEPGSTYDSQMSDWFRQTVSNGEFLDTYEELGFISGWAVWLLHNACHIKQFFNKTSGISNAKV